MITKNIKKNKGFVILFAVMLSSIILAITLGVANITLKEIKFSTSAKDTNDAFFAADIGTECALLNDKSESNSFVSTGGSGTVSCLGGTISLSGDYPLWSFVLPGLGSGGQGCAKVTVDKSAAPTTVVNSKGYNMGDVSCLSPNTDRVERELQATFIDNSQLPPPGVAKTVIANGDAQIDTVQSKFSGASGLFDGMGDYLYTADSDDWNFGNGNFTVDFWVRFNTLSGYNWLWSQRADSNNSIELFLYITGPDAYFQMIAVDNGNILVNYYTPRTAISLNTWYHVAVVRNSNSWKTYLNGANIHSQTANVTLPDISTNFVIGARGDDFFSPINGWIDEFRVSKGVARWTNDFTPPSSEYATDSYTKLLLHMNGTDTSTTFTDNSVAILKAIKNLAKNGLDAISGLMDIGSKNIF